MADAHEGHSMAPASTRLRQVALVSHDLERARHLLTKVLGTEVIFVDPAVEQWGLKNILVAIGGDIVEVVSPFKPNTTASRLLSKRGEGGYMIIMQTLDAKARREYLESTGKVKCIFMHESEDAVCIQYHPKGIRGGMMPELDSHTPSRTNPTPLESRFSPWHACGPLYSFPSYSAGMKRHSDLHLLSATCRLAPGDTHTARAAKQWQDLFGVQAVGDECHFSNSKLCFIAGQSGKPEALVKLNFGVEGRERLAVILARAKSEGLSEIDESGFKMLGIRWEFEVVDGDGSTRSLL